jgi:aspartyl-tRNA(Asn)/glutamyl-tRNA(Gln) amidotransferase subunit C
VSGPPITPDEVRRIAHLARLALTDAEVARLTRDLAQIISFFAQLESFPAAPALSGRKDDLRADEPRAGLTSEEALGPAPAVENGHFVLPRVVGP